LLAFCEVNDGGPRASDRFLYLTTTGRVSGLPRTIEIWFVEHAGSYYVIAERREAAQWVKNIERDSAVRVHVGARGESVSDAPAAARVIRDAGLVATVAALMDVKYGWSDGLVVEIVPAGDAKDRGVPSRS
jgi:deazaflavin-dependent oxidoreductase (nitroreductase family)